MNLKENLLCLTASFAILLAGPAQLSAQPQQDWMYKSCPSEVRYNPVSFSIGSKGYMGTGATRQWTPGTGTYLKDFWEFDPVNNTWTQKADVPGTARSQAVGIAIGAKGYIGLGIDSLQALSDFYEYDPTANTWTQKTAFAGAARAAATGFNIGNKGYIGTGAGFPDFWEYDPATNLWTRKADFAGSARDGAVSFSIGAKGYLGTGANTADFWEYDPSSDKWTQKADFGGAPRQLAAAFSINGKGYIGTGRLYSQTFPFAKDVWSYDAASNKWTQVADFDYVYSSTAFSIGNTGYLGMGLHDSDVPYRHLAI